MQSIDPKAFWQDKILKWEADRYSEGGNRRALLERIANRASPWPCSGSAASGAAPGQLQLEGSGAPIAQPSLN